MKDSTSIVFVSGTGEKLLLVKKWNLNLACFGRKWMRQEMLLMMMVVVMSTVTVVSNCCWWSPCNTDLDSTSTQESLPSSFLFQDKTLLFFSFLKQPASHSCRLLSSS